MIPNSYCIDNHIANKTLVNYTFKEENFSKEKKTTSIEEIVKREVTTS